MDEIALLSSRR